MTSDYNDTIIINLKIIGAIPENGRICYYKNCLSIDQGGSFQSLRRYLFSDSREITIDIIRSIIFSAINIYKVSVTEELSFTRNTIRGGLEKAKTGINNLKLTYSDDQTYCAMIDHLLSTIATFLESNK